MKNLLIIGAVVLLALAGGWYWWSNQPATSGDSQDTMYRTNDGRETPPEETTDSGDSKNTFANIFTSGENQTCNYSYTSPEGDVMSGTVYVSDNRMRSDYEMLQSNETVAGSMIQDGNTMYIWASNMPEGIKMTYDMQAAVEDSVNNPDTTQNPAPIDPNTEMDFDCTNWRVDDSVFTPPSDITFRDLSAMMESLPQGAPNMDNRCAMCDSLQGADQQTCREQLGC